jgi:hypothetical protein
MDQRLSRPVRWRMATTRGLRATAELQDLRSRWLTKMQELRDELENLRDEQAGKVKQLGDALADLICLQSEYNCWDVPENLEDSRLRSKLYDVQLFNFEALLDSLQELNNFPAADEIEEAIDSLDDPYEDMVFRLDEAREFDLPKGYGRD